MSEGGGGRRRRRDGIRPDDAIIGALGGAGLTYYGLVAHSFEHPIHWLLAGLGGFAGGVAVWAYAERARLLAWGWRLTHRRDARTGATRRGLRGSHDRRS
jgi:hypothetical protein